MTYHSDGCQHGMRTQKERVYQWHLSCTVDSFSQDHGSQQSFVQRRPIPAPTHSSTPEFLASRLGCSNLGETSHGAEGRWEEGQGRPLGYQEEKSYFRNLARVSSLSSEFEYLSSESKTLSPALIRPDSLSLLFNKELL